MHGEPDCSLRLPMLQTSQWFNKELVFHEAFRPYYSERSYDVTTLPAYNMDIMTS